MGRLDDIQTAIVAAVTFFFTNMHANKKNFGFIENSLNSFERGSIINQNTRPIQSRILKALCEDMGSIQTKFLFAYKRQVAVKSKSSHEVGSMEKRIAFLFS